MASTCKFQKDAAKAKSSTAGKVPIFEASFRFHFKGFVAKPDGINLNVILLPSMSSLLRSAKNIFPPFSNSFTANQFLHHCVSENKKGYNNLEPLR